MPICGFNEKMLEGITDFNEGLVEHGLNYRSQQNGESIDQAVKRELSDMARLKHELHRIEDAGKRAITEGIVKYAEGFYLLLRANGQEETAANPEAFIKGIGQYFFNMDAKYYGELEGRPDDMQALVEYLNNREI